MTGATGAIAAGMLGVAAEGDVGIEGDAGAELPAAALLFELLFFVADVSDPADGSVDVGAADAAGCGGDDGPLAAVEAALGFELLPHPTAATRQQRIDAVNVNLFDMSHLEVPLG